MADQHVVALVVVHRCVSIHDLGHDVAADLAKGGAKDDANVGLEPAEAGHELVNASQVVPGDDVGLVEEGEDVGLGVFDVGDGSEAEVLVDESLDDGVALAEGDVHLDGALAVADVVDLLVGDAVDVGEEGGQVVVGHVLEGELPELLVLVGVVLGVVARVLVPPAVPEPHVVPLVRQQEARRLVLVVDQPGVGAVQQSVLQDDGLEALPDGAALALDAKDGEDVTVLRDHPVRLDGVVVELAVVGELELGLGVRALHHRHQRKHQQQAPPHRQAWRFIINIMPFCSRWIYRWQLCAVV